MPIGKHRQTPADDLASRADLILFTMCQIFSLFFLVKLGNELLNEFDHFARISFLLDLVGHFRASHLAQVTRHSDAEQSHRHVPLIIRGKWFRNLLYSRYRNLFEVCVEWDI